jgi:glutamine synthetase type III
MDYKLILDVIVAILLAATIGYAATLNGRLRQLRKNRDDLARLVAAFNDATQRAEAGIPRLRRVAEEAGQALQERVEKAQTLRDDLAFMIERADAMANRLEGTVRTARSEARPSPAPAAGRPAAYRPPAAAAPTEVSYDDDEGDGRSEAERELLRALQSVR